MFNLLDALSFLLSASSSARHAFDRSRSLVVLRADALLAVLPTPEDTLHVYDLRLRILNHSSQPRTLTSVLVRVLSPQGKWLWSDTVSSLPVDIPALPRKRYVPSSILDASHTALPVVLPPHQESSILLRLPVNIGQAICDTHLNTFYGHAAADKEAPPTPYRRRRFSAADLLSPIRSAACVRPTEPAYPLHVCLQADNRSFSCRLQVVPHIERPAAIR